MVKMTIRALIIAVVLGFLCVTAQAVSAQTALEPTQIVIAAPARSNVGARVTVQAALADSKGHPISKAVIYFTTQAKFLGGTGDMVLAQAVTNGKGQAVADFADDFSGTVTLQAEFRGDTQYAPSNATAQFGTAGNQQVYAVHVGVDIPGFNVPPVGAPRAGLQSQQGILGFIQNLWPAMNGWPVAAVLLLVWSMYFFSVTFVFRVAALGSTDQDPTSTDPGRSL